MDQTQQNMGMFAPSDYKLSSLTIVTSAGNAIDVRPILLDLNIYEDIFSPVITGSMTLGDAGDIISSFQLHGNEYVLFEVDKPTLNRPIKKIFRIYKIADRTLNTTALQNYTIHFCSEELVLSTQISISKSYKGLTIDKMVKDLLTNRLKVAPEKMANGIFTATTGTFDLIVPRMQPFEAIEWLVPRAYNKAENLFFFFENRDGFNFTSYEHLIGLNSYTTYSRDVKIENDPSKNFTSYNFIQIVQDFDVIKSMRYGAYSSTLLSLDLINNSFTSKIFGYTDVTPKNLLNSQQPFNGLKNRFGFDLANSHSSMMKYVAHSDADPSFNPSLTKNWLPHAAARLAQINSFKVVMSVPGDVMLKAGAVVNVLFPKMLPQEQKTSNDNLRTGRYLVSSVHHKFVQDIMTTVVELLSDSVGIALDKSQDTMPAMQKIIKS